MSFTLWFTGLSGSGKTTLSSAVYRELRCRGMNIELFDGDIIRKNLSKGLTFCREDRIVNVRRIGFICHLLNKHGVACLVAAIAPYAEARQSIRALLEDSYIEAFCQCPLEVTEARDVKGLYALARAGEIQNFTGISDPYDDPENPDILIPTHKQTEDESYDAILRHLADRSLIPGERVQCEKEYEAQESAWRTKLVELGYLSNGNTPAGVPSIGPGGSFCKS